VIFVSFVVNKFFFSSSAGVELTFAIAKENPRQSRGAVGAFNPLHEHGDLNCRRFAIAMAGIISSHTPFRFFPERQLVQAVEGCHFVALGHRGGS